MSLLIFNMKKVFMKKDRRLDFVSFQKGYRLILVLKSLHKKDTAPMRQAIYNQFVKYSKASIFIKLYERLPSCFQRVLIFIFSIKFLGEVIDLSKFDCDEVAVWERFPERNHISMIPVEGKRVEYRPRFSLVSFCSNCCVIKIAYIIKYWRVLGQLTKRYNLLSALRSAEVICKSYLNSLIDTDVKRVIVSSDASPLSLSILLGFKDRAIVIHTPHGIVPNSEHLIYFDRNYYTTLYNYNEMGMYCLGENVYIGEPVKEVKFQNCIKPVVGIVISIIPSEDGINNLITELNKKNIIPKVKLHPNVIGKTSWKGKYEIVKSLDDTTVIISGNSGHIVKMLRQGVFVAFEDSLDNAPADIYGLKKRGIVYEYDINSILDFDKYSEFYESKTWKENWSKI